MTFLSFYPHLLHNPLHRHHLVLQPDYRKFVKVENLKTTIGSPLGLRSPLFPNGEGDTCLLSHTSLFGAFCLTVSNIPNYLRSLQSLQSLDLLGNRKSFNTVVMTLRCVLSVLLKQGYLDLLSTLVILRDNSQVSDFSI